MIGKYHGYGYKLQRICDVIHVKSTQQYFFLYEHGEATGDHFKTLAALKRYIDALPAITD